jgi:ElaB/YqjD/DUF883 family membrane-anchored ribosome-binding protein
MATLSQQDGQHSPQAEIEHAILRIEEAFQALDFGTEKAAEDAHAQIASALEAIRYEMGKASSSTVLSTEELEERG